MRKVIFAAELPRKFVNFASYLKFLGKRKAQVLLNKRKQIMEKSQKDSLDVGSYLYKLSNTNKSRVPFPSSRHSNCSSNSSLKRNKFQAKAK